MNPIPTLFDDPPLTYWVCKCRPLDARVHPMSSPFCRDCKVNRGEARAATPIEILNLTRYKAQP